MNRIIEKRKILRRKVNKVEVIQAVLPLAKSQRFTCLIENISLSGMMLLLPLGFDLSILSRLGNVINLQVLMKFANKEFSITGFVKWIGPVDGVGGYALAAGIELDPEIDLPEYYMALVMSDLYDLNA